MNSAAHASHIPVQGNQAGKYLSKQAIHFQELVGTTQEKRNWRGIIIALIVIVTVLSLIITAIVLVTPKDQAIEDKKKLNFKSYIRDEYEPRLFQPTWFTGEESFVYKNHDGAIVEFNCAENTSNVIMDNATFRELNSWDFRLSADKKFVMFPYKVERIYRHSTLAKYKIVNINNTREQRIISGNHKQDLFQYVSWSPVGHSIICVQYNDMFYLREPINGSMERLTYDGYSDIDHVFNGIPDWVYEEEVLHSDNAIWFSPDGKYIVYGSFDDRDVSAFEMTIYGDSNDYYVKTKQLPYPKPGFKNPKVKLYVSELTTNSTTELAPPIELQSRDYYFTMVLWQDNTTVLISWLNREQNVSIVTICNVVSSICKKNLRVEADGGWLDMHKPILSEPGGERYFILLPHKDGSAGSLQHVAMVDAKEDISAKPGDGSKMFLIDGKLDVSDIVGYDHEMHLLYFLATETEDPRMRHLYSVTTLKDSEDFRHATCRSCDFHEGCKFVEAAFSSTGKYYVLACKGPDVPSYHLFSANGGFVKTLEDNAHLKKLVSDMSMPVTEFIKIPIDEDSNEEIWTKVLLPPVLKKDEILTYNILFKVYGAPGTQLATHEFGIGWEYYLCSAHGIIIVFVDGRGTSGRGNNWLHSVYKRLGTYEIDDVITAARYFNNLPYVNKLTTAIWGLSYGGFISASVIGRGTSEFRCGMSVAPVTDWRYYDSVYTERYMGMPTANDNLAAYNVANISRHARGFRSSKFMLIHGTGDDNVHFQNSAQLMKALTEEDVYFRSQIYTDESHFLDHGNTKTHLYNSMEEFVLHCYGKPKLADELYNDVSEKDDGGGDEEE